ncbi:DUF2934 domain-containing protein [Methylomicrobium sp. Wu6]|uniref:DUF2934 domain-containing protein n=1 Tax=Methylomicrobium sp. Wu6 TaxID=3107928 RepID=UPI002DD697E2|nr:DUF2934 domain-containing protein [Methylomicrobium sp. Wu6]MEC4748205.1 DUF2934 domain-containing protein [Methylomicrobium sp. Wu6]
MKPTENNIHQNTEILTHEESGMALDSTAVKTAKIAELAYYKAERRGFEPGHEWEDWLEAERELASTEDNSSIGTTSSRT